MRLLPILFMSAAVGSTLIARPQQQPDPAHPRGQGDPTQAQPGQRDPTSATGASSRMDDGILATWILIENNNEIELSQLAATRASDPEVKQFAQKMVDEHRAMGGKLQTFASVAGYTGSSAGRAPGGASNASGTDSGRSAGDGAKPTDGSKPAGDPGKQADPTDRASPGSTRATASGIDHVALLQELGSQCLQSARKELEAKSGAEFDRCYTGMALGAHMKVNDQLTVFQRHASPELRSVFAEGQKTVQAHLEHAKQLAKKLEGKSSASPGSTDKK